MGERGAWSGSELPAGFLYQPEFLSQEEESNLLHHIGALPFEAFNFQVYLAKATDRGVRLGI